MESYKNSIKNKPENLIALQQESKKKQRKKMKRKKPRNIIKKRGKYEPKLFQLFKLF